ncbi:MAG: hypothetical protein AB7U43_04030 [Desulfobacter sp.]
MLILRTRFYSFEINKVLLTVVFAWSFLSGLGVYFNDLNEYGEFALTSFQVLLGDFLILFIIVAIVMMNCKNRKLFVLNKFEISLWFFVIISIFASVKGFFSWGLNEYVHFFLRNQIYYIIVGYIVYSVAKEFDKIFFEKLFRFAFFSNFIISLALFALEFFDGFNGKYLWGGTRLCGTLINHNNYGFISVFFLFWSYFSDMNHKWIMVFISFVLIMASGSLTAVSSLLFLMFISPRVFLFYVVIALFSILFFWEDLSKIHLIYKVTEVLLNEDTHLTSASARINQLEFVRDLLVNVFNWPIGILDSHGYLRFDSQYYNLIVNLGVVSFCSFLCVAVYAIFYTKKNHFKLFVFWLFVIAFSLTAFMSRWNVIIIIFFILAYFHSSKNTCIVSKSN